MDNKIHSETVEDLVIGETNTKPVLPDNISDDNKVVFHPLQEMPGFDPSVHRLVVRNRAGDKLYLGELKKINPLEYTFAPSDRGRQLLGNSKDWALTMKTTADYYEAVTHTQQEIAFVFKNKDDADKARSQFVEDESGKRSIVNF